MVREKRKEGSIVIPWLSAEEADRIRKGEDPLHTHGFYPFNWRELELEFPTRNGGGTTFTLTVCPCGAISSFPSRSIELLTDEALCTLAVSLRDNFFKPNFFYIPGASLPPQG